MSYINKVSSWVLAGVFAVFVGGSVVTLTTSGTTWAVTYHTCTSAQKILTFPVWYDGLTVSDTDCNIVDPSALNTATNGTNNGLSNFIWRIVLNLIDIALQVVGYIAVGFILYGGFSMITSNGSPDSNAKARKTILNAVIGLVISIGSVAIVNLIMGIIK